MVAVFDNFSLHINNITLSITATATTTIAAAATILF